MVDAGTAVSTDLLQILHSYIDRGWNVFPVEPNGKRPVVIKQGIDHDGNSFEIRLSWKEFEYNRISKEQVSSWYEKFPDCNWGLICGKISNVCVVDIDGSDGVASLRKYHPEMENTKTLTQATPHGFHLIFKYSGNPTKSFPILPKVDVKADGGYVVIAPSKTLDGNYRFILEVALATCPGWVARGERSGFDAPTESTVGEDQQPMWVSALLMNGSPSGRRNHDAARLVGYFHNRNVSKDIIERIILPWAEKCQPPFDMKELRTVVRSVSSYQAMAKSRGVAEPPVMTTTGVGSKFYWDQLNIDIEVSRLLETERNGLVGEIEVHTNGIPSVPKYLYGPIDFAFKDGRSHSALVMELDKRMHGPPWAQIVTDFSRLVLGQHSKGSEWQLLREANRSVAFGYAYRPILLAKEPTLWFSAGGGMKSYLALVLAVMMETGLDVGIGPALVRHHVAYLDWEWDVGQHAKRLDSILSPEDQEKYHCNILYRQCGGRPLRKQIEEIKRMVAEEGITFIICDSASPASGRASDNDEIVAFFQSITELKVGALILAHVTKEDRKNSDDNASTAYGGVQWENQSRSAWNLKKIQEEGSSDVDLVLTHQKVNGGPLSLPFSVRFRFPEESDPDQRVSMRMGMPGEVLGESSREAGVSLRDQIKMALKKRPLTVEQLADELGGTSGNAILLALRSMEKKSVIRTIRTIDGEMNEIWGLRTGAGD